MNKPSKSGAFAGWFPDPEPQQQPQQRPNPYRPPAFQASYQQPQQQYQPYQPPLYQEPYQEPQRTERGGNVLAFFNRRDVVVLITAVICAVWLLIAYNIVGGLLSGTPTGDSAEELGQALGTAIGAAMTIPFFVLAFIGQVFNWGAWLTSRKGFMLTATILYCVSLLFGFSYGIGLILCIALGFIGYARLKRRQ